MSDTDRDLLIALNTSDRISRAVICSLSASFEEWRGARSANTDLAHTLGVPTACLRSALKLRSQASKISHHEQARATRVEASLVTLLDPNYPEILRQLALPPPVLYWRGSLGPKPATPTPAIAMVGSRRADRYGIEVAERFAGCLAEAGVTIVSGFALGIDAAAHRGALSALKGRTLAILGCGLGVDYPRGQHKLGEQIAQAGALITEFPVGVAPKRWHFPIRNRLIAAFTSGTLVVQAAARSGSLITARLALELGRDVFAVPGRIFDHNAVGPNTLIRDGAFLVQHPRDIIERLPTQLQLLLETASADRSPSATSSPVPGPAGSLLQQLAPGESRSPDELAGLTTQPVEQVLADLLELELGGWVERLPGPRYRRATAQFLPRNP